MNSEENLERKCGLLLYQLQQTLSNYKHMASHVNNRIEKDRYEETFQLRLNFVEEIKNAMQSNGLKVAVDKGFSDKAMLDPAQTLYFDYELSLRGTLKEDILLRAHYEKMLAEETLPSGLYTIVQDHLYKIDALVKELQRVVSVYN
ncbi:hypothetical protein [Aquimarina intermedia]|uniref:DUF2383 domain-containing protein n=1 Tax=Aquimarina intermedia TaxID=350814 RepID=A0A5S5CFR3_9FLAO|nr:hypothetical protein [Aquimarina intermedia]TYP77200.1 hypothetical protein BD809_101350 [Aquimarina intermedia]